MRTIKDKLKSLMIAATTDNGHMLVYDLVGSFDFDDSAKIREMAEEICKENGWSYNHPMITRIK